MDDFLIVIITALGFIAFILPLWDIICYKKRLTPRGLGIVLAGFFILILTIWKGFRDNQHQTDAQTSSLNQKTSIDSLNTLLREQTSRSLKWHLIDSAFQKKLLDTFSITRDSSSNEPLKVIQRNSVSANKIQTVNFTQNVK